MTEVRTAKPRLTNGQLLAVIVGLLVIALVAVLLLRSVFTDDGASDDCKRQYADRVAGRPVIVTADCRDFVYG